MDNQGTMGISTINRLVGGQQEAHGIYRTIEACNAGGSISPNYEVEELEELEARGLNPYWDKNAFRTKLNNLSYVKGAEYYHNLFAVVDRLDSHNTIFPDVAYIIIGFMENKNGFPALVLQQSYVNSVERNATKEEIENYLISKGFSLSGSRCWSNNHNVWNNGVFELFDARPANVLKGFDGQLYFVDTFPHSIKYMQQIIR